MKSSNHSWIKYNQTAPMDEICQLELPNDYDLHLSIGHIFLILLGLFYGLLGYRCWRLNMFLTSFALSSLLIYVILVTQPTLTQTQLIFVSCAIATLVGLIGSLLQYVGLFINGFCFGLIFSIITFIFWDMKNLSNGISTSFWLPICLIFFIGLLCAMLTLRFQKAMIIITSSCSSGVCQMLVADYFLQSSLLIHFIHQRLIFQSTPTLCIRHWIVAFILPIVMLFSIVIQFSCTGKNYDHRDAWQRGKNLRKSNLGLRFSLIRLLNFDICFNQINKQIIFMFRGYSFNVSI